MPITQLDHVNIRTARLAACVEFYGNVLGLTMTPPPMATDMALGAYGRDDGGAAIVHLVATDQVVEGADPVRGAAQRGMIDHFALRCVDLAAFVVRLTARGCQFSRLDVTALGLSLIFVRDPNGVLIELAFPLEGPT